MSATLMPVTILDWRPFTKGSLLGFVKIRLGALEITDVTVMASGERKWAGLPARPQVDRDDTLKKDNGKIVYSKILGWNTKEASDRFSDSVIAALREAYPDALT